MIPSAVPSAAPAPEPWLDTVSANIPGMVYQRVLKPDGAIALRLIAGRMLREYGLARPGAYERGRFLEHIHPGDRERVAEALRRSAAELSPLTIEFRVQRPAGEYLWLESTSNPRREADGSVVWDAVAIDVTERRRASASLRLLQRASLAVAEAADYDAALRTVLSLVREAGDWDYAESWVPDQSGERLVLGPAVHDGEPHWAAFEAESRPLSFAPGHSLVGTVWLTRQPHWERDLGLYEGPSTAAIAMSRRAGVKSLHIVPITAGEEVVAVLVFGMANVRERDEGLNDTVVAVAAQLGTALRRKQVEQALRASEQRFRDIAEVAVHWIWETGPDHRFTFMSSNVATATEFDVRGVIGKTRWELAGGDPDRDETWRRHKADLDAHRPFRHFTMSRPSSAGSRLYLSVSGKPVFDEAGRFLGYRGTASDETAIVEARERTARAEALLSDAMESTPDGFTIFDRDDRLVMSNGRNRDLHGNRVKQLEFGITFEELIRAGVAAGMYPDAAGREEAWIAERLRQHREAAGMIEQRLAHGRWLLITERRMQNGGTICSYVDVTALKQAQAALSESEARLVRAQELAGIGSWELDMPRRRYVWSRQMHRILGIPSEAADPGQITRERTHPDDLAHTREWEARLRAAPGASAIEVRFERSPGDWRIIRAEGQAVADASGGVVKVAGTIQDVTELRRAEERRHELERQLLHAHKMEAIGVLASGIAHDFNNALLPVILISKLNIQALPPEGELGRDFAIIHQAAARASSLVKQILAFGRNEPVERRRFRIDEVLSDALSMLRASIPTTIAIASNIAEAGEIFGDPTQIHQVVVNLVTNASHAIGERPGTIAVSLTRCPPADDGPTMVGLAVSDTGHGMDEETMGRIFEPFFTTKGVGEGTGLGLSVVHGIVAAHNGTIRVASERGRGSCFTVELPTADADIEAGAAPEIAA